MLVNIKKILLPLGISILGGFLCGRVVYDIYNDTNENLLFNNKVYLIQTGAYSTYNNMRANTLGYDYVYYEDDDLFKTIIGLTMNKDNIEKITNTYDGEVLIMEYYLSNKELLNKIKDYDEIINQETNEERIKEIVLDLLELYKEKKITLTKVLAK